MRKRNIGRCAAAATALAMTAQHVDAATPSSWSSPISGNWTDATKWSTDPNFPSNDTPLGATYDAIIAATGSAYTVTLDANITVNSLTIDWTDATFIQTVGALTGDLALRRGAFTQSGGTQNSYIAVGAQAGDDFSYNLTGGSLSSQVYIEVGVYGSGTFNHSGGTNSTRGLYLAAAAGSSGVYNLTGTGTLTPGQEYIGNVGSGTFNHTDGPLGGPGPTNSAPELYLGNAPGSSGTYNFSGTGSLTVSADEYVGNLGDGKFIQSGSTTHTVGRHLYVSNGSASTGTYSLSESAQLAVGRDEYIGHGNFEQNGASTHSVGRDLYLGFVPNPIASYGLSGTSTLTVARNEYIGLGGTGSFTQSGGMHTVTGTLSLAGSATYALSGGTLAIGALDTSGTLDARAGTVNGPITGVGGVTKTTAGTVTLSGVNTYTGGTNVQAGMLQVTKLHQDNAVTITGGTLRVLESSPGLASGHPAGDDARLSMPSSLSISAGGTLDLTNNDLILDYSGASPVAAYEALVACGYNVTGDWAGTGITSSIAALDGNYVVAIADNATLSAPFGSAQGGPLFSGFDVDLDTILIKFAHRADINLDGVITPDDSAVFGGSYDENQPAVWAQGDMNYDGIFTPDDAAIFGGAYDESLTSLPEPRSLGVLAAGCAGLLARRRVGAWGRQHTHARQREQRDTCLSTREVVLRGERGMEWNEDNLRAKKLGSQVHSVKSNVPLIRLRGRVRRFASEGDIR